MLKSIKDNISAGMKALKPSPGVSYFPFVYLFPLYHSYFIYMKEWMNECADIFQTWKYYGEWNQQLSHQTSHQDSQCWSPSSAGQAPPPPCSSGAAELSAAARGESSISQTVSPLFSVLWPPSSHHFSPQVHLAHHRPLHRGWRRCLWDIHWQQSKQSRVIEERFQH